MLICFKELCFTLSLSSLQIIKTDISNVFIVCKILTSEFNNLAAYAN